jgi:DNA-binding transcriptional LysR family regulator
MRASPACRTPAPDRKSKKRRNPHLRRSSLGITQAPYWLFAADIRAGTVRRILRDHEPSKLPISAVRPASRRQPSKVAVFVDFLAELLVDEKV